VKKNTMEVGMDRLGSAFAICLFLLPGFAQEVNKLPIQRVVLYKNGVGYFEHTGRVRDNQDVAISFTSGQLNDVLKSLTVLDLNGGRITGVGYGSATPVDRQIGDLRLGVGERTTLPEFLAALRGARLEVRSGTTIVTGRLLGVERKPKVVSGTTMQVDDLSLMTESGELRTVELSSTVSVRLLERELTGKVGRFLDLSAATREPDVRRMVIATEGSGERSVFVSYISEVPVWKTTYRVVLSSKAGHGPLLQGWAIVDNTVGEDWDNVQLSLVAGAPQSFIQNLSQPYYSRRPIVPLPESVNMSPQTFESTLIPGGTRLSGVVTDQAGVAVAHATVKALDLSGGVAGQTHTDVAGNYEFQGLAEGAYRIEVESAGFQRIVINGTEVASGRTTRQDATLQVGSVSQAVEVNAESLGMSTKTDRFTRTDGTHLGTGGMPGRLEQFAKLQTPSAPLRSLEMVRASTQASASAQTLGDLFEYKLKQLITIQKNRSALVPIVQSSIGAEKVSVWNEQVGLPRPQRALWLNNSSGLTLDGGSFSVLEDETFAGEGVMEPIRPGEKRLVSYAVDLAVNASSKLGMEQQRVTRVRVNRGVIIHDSEVREKKTYTFRNEDSSPRTILVEHPVRPGYELRGEARPAETTAAWMRFRLPVEPKQTTMFTVEEARPIQSSYQLTNVTSEQVALFVQQKSIDKTVEDALRRVLAQKDVIADLSAQQEARESEQKRIFNDQQRLRENLKALKGSADEKALIQRYTQQLNEQENRLETLKKESAQIEAKQDKEQAALDRMIQELSFDVKL
jgi:hypothetical protein